MNKKAFFAIAFLALAVPVFASAEAPIKLDFDPNGALEMMRKTKEFRENFGPFNAADYLNSLYDSRGVVYSPETIGTLIYPLYVKRDAKPNWKASKAILDAENVATVARKTTLAQTAPKVTPKQNTTREASISRASASAPERVAKPATRLAKQFRENSKDSVSQREAWLAEQLTLATQSLHEAERKIDSLRQEVERLKKSQQLKQAMHSVENNGREVPEEAAAQIVYLKSVANNQADELASANQEISALKEKLQTTKQADRLDSFTLRRESEDRILKWIFGIAFLLGVLIGVVLGITQWRRNRYQYSWTAGPEYWLIGPVLSFWDRLWEPKSHKPKAILDLGLTALADKCGKSGSPQETAVERVMSGL